MSACFMGCPLLGRGVAWWPARDELGDEVVGPVVGQDRLGLGQKRGGEFGQRRAFGVGLDRAKHLDGQARAARGTPVAALARDRQAPHKVLEPPFSKNVVPKPDPLDQFSFGVDEVRNRQKLALETTYA